MTLVGAFLVMLLVMLASKPTYGARSLISRVSTISSDSVISEDSAVNDVSVLMVGDSQSFTLGEGFVPPVEAPDMKVNIGAILGCGVVLGRPVIEGVPHSDTFEHCDSWEQTWSDGMSTKKPDVTVMLIGAWEILDHMVDGRHLKVGSAEYDAYVEAQLVRAFNIATSNETPVVFLSAPCFRESEASLGGLEGDRNNPERRDWFNRLSANVAVRYPDLVTRFDLGEFLCPDGTFAEEINGVIPRPDGVHFGKEGAQEVWRWLAPQVIEIASS